MDELLNNFLKLGLVLIAVAVSFFVGLPLLERIRERFWDTD